jgi:Ni/Fe-hydrogenase 1 B-type cytochrome subunit
MATYEKHQCWSILLRLFHWMFALAIVFLVVTGFYINNPWTNTMIEGSASFPMATMRYIHFIAAYTFSAAVLIRLFLYIFGNAQERIWDFLPVTKRNLNNLKMTLLNYSYISDKHDARLGHNILAGLTYIITVIAAIFMIASGFFMLYPEAPFWQNLGGTLFGSQQFARFLHHLTMWWFMIFAVIHIYFLIWNDNKNPEGLISSIFTGDKFKHKA